MARVDAQICLTDRHGGRVPLPRPVYCGGLDRATRRSGASSDQSAVMLPSIEVVHNLTTICPNNQPLEIRVIVAECDAHALNRRLVDCLCYPSRARDDRGLGKCAVRH
jgi:hypothetical protein